MISPAICLPISARPFYAILFISFRMADYVSFTLLYLCECVCVYTHATERRAGSRWRNRRRLALPPSSKPPAGESDLQQCKNFVLSPSSSFSAFSRCELATTTTTSATVARAVGCFRKQTGALVNIRRAAKNAAPRHSLFCLVVPLPSSLASFYFVSFHFFSYSSSFSSSPYIFLVFLFFCFLNSRLKGGWLGSRTKKWRLFLGVCAPRERSKRQAGI